mmetsp:Transcript_31988/g.94112  ORF Transcript_31988/g.94112 Transcript_31988/m.94112 type:complete len:222 (+) Transcript_31988:1183-1848(+)
MSQRRGMLCRRAAAEFPPHHVRRAGEVSKVVGGISGTEAECLPALLLRIERQAAHHPVAGIGSPGHERVLRECVRCHPIRRARSRRQDHYSSIPRQWRRRSRGGGLHPARQGRRQHRALANDPPQDDARNSQRKGSGMCRRCRPGRDRPKPSPSPGRWQHCPIRSVGRSDYVDLRNADRPGTVPHQKECHEGKLPAPDAGTVGDVHVVPPGFGDQGESEED